MRTHPEWEGVRDSEGRPWLTCNDLKGQHGPCCGSCISDEEYGSPPGHWDESPDKSIYFEGCCNHDLRHWTQEQWDALLRGGTTEKPE